MTTTPSAQPSSSTPAIRKLPGRQWPDLQITEEIEQVLGQNPHLLINLSGGKDSTLMAFLLVSMFKFRLPISFIWADTGQEYKENPGKWEGAEVWGRKQAALFGYELHVVRHPTKTYFERVRERGKWPATGKRYCTSDFKAGPINKWLRNNIYEPIIINAMGHRAGESDERKNMLPWELDKTLTTQRARLTGSPRTVYNWLPIHHWGTEDVYAFIAAYDLPLHPIYQFLDRYSCQVCIYNTARDLSAIRRHNPIAFYEAADLEQEIGHTMHTRKRKGEVIRVSIIELADKYDAGQIVEKREPRQSCLW